MGVSRASPRTRWWCVPFESPRRLMLRQQPSHCVVTEFSDPVAMRLAATRGARVCQRMWSIHPSRVIEPIRGLRAERGRDRNIFEHPSWRPPGQTGRRSTTQVNLRPGQHRYYWQVLERASHGLRPAGGRPTMVRPGLRRTEPFQETFMNCRSRLALAPRAVCACMLASMGQAHAQALARALPRPAAGGRVNFAGSRDGGGRARDPDAAAGDGLADPRAKHPLRAGPEGAHEADLQKPGYFNVHARERRFRMAPVATSTGPIGGSRTARRRRVVAWPTNPCSWIRSKGKRLADECMTPAQAAAAEWASRPSRHQACLMLPRSSRPPNRVRRSPSPWCPSYRASRCADNASNSESNQ